MYVNILLHIISIQKKNYITDLRVLMRFYVLFSNAITTINNKDMIQNDSKQKVSMFQSS